MKHTLSALVGQGAIPQAVCALKVCSFVFITVSFRRFTRAHSCCIGFKKVNCGSTYFLNKVLQQYVLNGEKILCFSHFPVIISLGKQK